MSLAYSVSVLRLSTESVCTGCPGGCWAASSTVNGMDNMLQHGCQGRMMRMMMEREVTGSAALQTSTKDLGGSHEAAAAAVGSSVATGTERLPSVASSRSPEPKV